MHSSYVPRRREWQEAIIEQIKANNQDPFELTWTYGVGKRDTYMVDLKALVQTNTKSGKQRAIRPAWMVLG